MLQPNGKTFQLQLSMLELQWLEGIDRETCSFNILVVYPCLRLRITWASKQRHGRCMPAELAAMTRKT